MQKIEQITAFGLNFDLFWGDIPAKVKNAGIACTPDYFFLNVKDVAKYYAIPNQNQIILEKNNDNINFEIIATWLYGVVLSYFLHYHKFLVLHGSAVVIDKQAKIFCGVSTAGKSTLATALNRKGYPLLTDDVAIVKFIDEKPFLVPGPAKVKLWQDTLNQFDLDSSNLKQILVREGKYEYPIDHSYQEPIQISHLFELNKSDDVNEVTIENYDNMEKLKVLIRHTFRYNMLKPLDLLNSHLNQCSKLASQIAIFKVLRPTTSFLLDELTKQVLHRVTPNNS